MFIKTVYKPGCDVINFAVKLIFLFKSFFLHQKAMTKTKISSEWKELLRWNKKAFFINFQGLSVKLITHIFWEGESPTLISIIFDALF